MFEHLKHQFGLVIPFTLFTKFDIKRLQNSKQFFDLPIEKL
jgi:hypothetical protein